jgi:hypothetical protein
MLKQSLSMLGRHSAKGLIVLLFSIPVLASLLLEHRGSAENRNLAPLPPTPHTLAEAAAWPGKAELWVNDHLGLRNELVALNNRARYLLFRQFPTHQLLEGANGRLFLSAYNTADAPYSGIQSLCGYGVAADTSAIMASHLNTFGETMRAQQLDGRLLLVPSAPLVYREDLPLWIQARCAASAIPIQRAMASPLLRESASVLYPLDALRAARGGSAVFPATWFHWAGDGVRLAAEISVGRFWKVPATPPLASTVHTLPSDVDNLAPGMGLSSQVREVDFAASGVKECHGGTCFPEMPELMAKLWGVNRYHNPSAPLPRLVLLTDSFGIGAGPWYARYYQDVLQVATNDLARLTPDEVRQLKGLLFQRQTPQNLLFLYHDGTVQGGARIPADLQLLFPPPERQRPAAN